jgi:hypothetical protein
MQTNQTAVAARNSTVPARGAEHDETQPVGLADLAERLATDGPVALQRELRCLIREARRHGVTPLLVTILADPSQPDVARQRAFGRVLAELERPHEPQPHPARTASDAASASVAREPLTDAIDCEQRARTMPPLSARPAPLSMSLWTSTANWRFGRRRQSAAAPGLTRVTCPGHALPPPAQEAYGRHRPPGGSAARTRRNP